MLAAAAAAVVCCFESGSINRQAVRRGEKLIRSSFPPQIQEDSETYEMNILAKVVAVGLVATLCCANHNTAIKVRHAAPRRACLLACPDIASIPAPPASKSEACVLDSL